jgi:hypothetical protein
MTRLEEIKDRAKYNDDTDMEDRDWLIAALAEKDKIINVFAYLLLHHGIISRGKASSVIEIDRAEIDGWMEKMAAEWRKEAQDDNL